MSRIGTKPPADLGHEMILMNGDPTAPLPYTFQNRPDKLKSFLQSSSNYPGFQSYAIDEVKSEILRHSMFSERGFVYAAYSQDGILLESAWYPSTHLPRVAGGKLMKDAQFIQYIADHSPSTQTCAYVSLPVGFTASVISIISLFGGIEALETHLNSKGFHMHPLGAPCRNCCGSCAKQIPDMKCCAVCKQVFYCSKECQTDAWQSHRTTHKKETKKESKSENVTPSSSSSSSNVLEKKIETTQKRSNPFNVISISNKSIKISNVGEMLASSDERMNQSMEKKLEQTYDRMYKSMMK